MTKRNFLFEHDNRYISTLHNSRAICRPKHCYVRMRGAVLQKHINMHTVLQHPRISFRFQMLLKSSLSTTVRGFYDAEWHRNKTSISKKRSPSWRLVTVPIPVKLGRKGISINLVLTGRLRNVLTRSDKFCLGVVSTLTILAFDNTNGIWQNQFYSPSWVSANPITPYRELTNMWVVSSSYAKTGCICMRCITLWHPAMAVVRYIAKLLRVSTVLWNIEFGMTVDADLAPLRAIWLTFSFHQCWLLLRPRMPWCDIFPVMLKLNAIYNLKLCADNCRISIEIHVTGLRHAPALIGMKVYSKNISPISVTKHFIPH